MSKEKDITDIRNHQDAGPPSRGDLFTQPTSGKWGVIEAVLSGGAVEVDVFAGGDLPDTPEGRTAKAMGITQPNQFRTREVLMLNSIQVHRPPIGGRFGLDTRELNVNANKVEVHRHLGNGFLEVRMVVHVTELLEPREGRVDLEEDEWPQAHPGGWPVVKP